MKKRLKFMWTLEERLPGLNAQRKRNADWAEVKGFRVYGTKKEAFDRAIQMAEQFPGIYRLMPGAIEL